MTRRARGSSEALVGPGSEEARANGSAQMEPEVSLPRIPEAEAKIMDPIISAKYTDEDGIDADGPRARRHWRLGKNR